VTEQGYTLNFNPSTLTINLGQSGTANVSMSTTGGFSGTVTFGCTPPPDSDTTCSFSPSVVASTGTTTMVIGTTKPAVRGGPTVAGIVVRLLLLPFAALPLLLLLPAGRSRLRAGMLLALTAAVLLLHTGCAQVNVNPATGSSSGTGGGGGSTNGTPTGTLNFTITTSGSSTGVSGSYTERQTASYMVTTQ
jgi:hypothetical protein